MSYHTLSTKNSLNAGVKNWLKRGAHLGLGIGAFTPVLALANPTGGVVVGGANNATIATPSANDMVITQKHQSAIINWQQFNIGRGQYVQFLQPSSSSVILNRVIGGGGTSILGNLHGNGQVFLVNTNGVYFGKGATIDAQGFLASTLDIDDSDFLAHNYQFTKAGANTSGVSAKTVVNDGSIIAHPGGYVVLAGDYSQNDGLISAQSGHIILASGAKSTLTLSGNGLVNYAVDQATLASLAGANNAGKLIADGGMVVMTADVANLLKATVVNNTGLIEAHAISKAGGTIQLLASGGDIQNAGTIDADAARSGLTGGAITLKGDERTTLTATSQISALGEGADGGKLEVSGNTISVRGTAKLGKGGQMLLDPGEMQIVLGTASSSKDSPGLASNNTSVGHIGVNFIQKQLNGDVAVTIQATNTIDASANVKTITATKTALQGGGGAFNLIAGTTAVSGNIELKGVDINITGKLTASMGYGGSFGHLIANSIEMHATDPVIFAPDVVNSKGAITTYSARATGGNLSIQAPNVTASGELGLALIATGSMDIDGNISAAGNLTLQAQSVRVTGSADAGGAFKAVASNGHAAFHQVTAQTGINVSATTTNSGSNISATGIHAYGGGIVLKDTGGGIDVGGAVRAEAGNVSITATGNDIKTGSVTAQTGSVTVNAGANDFTVSHGEGGHGAVGGGKGVSITAKDIFFTGSTSEFVISGGQGAATIKGQFGSGSGFDHGLEIDAATRVTLDHSIKTAGSLAIHGSNLVFTDPGKTGNFSLSASGGDLVLDAPIGTVAAPVKYNVNLSDTSGAIFVRGSIFTTGSISANANLNGSDTLQGVIVGNSDGNVTLSATKNINITGANIGIGKVDTGIGVFSAQQVSLIAGGDVDLTAVGSSSGRIGNVDIQAGEARGDAGATNTSILIQAGGDIAITGNRIDLRAGEASASLSAGLKTRTVTDTADVTLKAGGSLDITASGSSNRVEIDAGSVFGLVNAGANHALTVNLDASVSLTAGKAMAIAASSMHISHGYGAVATTATGTGAVANLNEKASISLKAGTTLSLTGNGSSSEAGVYIGRTDNLGQQGRIQMQASNHGKIAVTEHADVNITAGASIGISGRRVQVSAGYGLASQTPGPGDHSIAATGAGATATYTATADLNFKAGAGGITLSGPSSGEAAVSVTAGGGVGKHLEIFGSYGGIASANLHANVNMVTTGNVLLQGATDASIHGADSAASGVLVTAKHKGVARLTAGGNVSISAKDFTMSSGEGNSASMSIAGGRKLGAHTGPIAAESGGSVSITDSARVDINATGSITVTDKNAVGIIGGSAAGISGSFGANAGKVAVSNDAGVSLTATGNIKLTGGIGTGSNDLVFIAGGNSPGNRHGYEALQGGTLTDTTLSRIDIHAGGSFSANANSVKLFGGVRAGGSRGVTASSDGYGATKASVVSDNSLNVTAGSIKLTGVQVRVGAGQGAGANVTSDSASGAKAVTSLTVNAGANLNATGAFIVDAGTYAELFSGFSAGHAMNVTGSGGKAAATINAGLSIKAGSVLLQNNSGGRQSISGARHVGSSTDIHASSGGSANVKVNAGLSIVTTGTFIASGADRTLIVADSAAGKNASLNNNGGVKVTDTLNNSVTISAKSVTLSAANSVEFFAGASDLTNARVNANGGTAAMNVNSSLNLTAAKGITVNVTGTGGSSSTRRRIVLSGGDNALNMNVSATHHGNAAISLTDGITITAGGAVALKNTGVGATSTTVSGASPSSIVNVNHASHGVFVVAGSRIGGGYTTFSGSHSFQHNTEVQTGTGGGTATLTANAGVTIATKGGFTADAGTGSLLAGGGSVAASNATVLARASGKASATVTQDLNVTAASAAFSGGNVVLAAGFSDGDQTNVLASHAGVATLNAETALRVTTTGALTVTGTAVTVTGGGGSSSVHRPIGGGFLGAGASVQASHGGQATLIATSTVQLKAASVTMSASDGPLQIASGVADGIGLTVDAHGKGDKATATLNGAVSITATTGAISLTAKGTPTTASSQLGSIGIVAGSGAGVGERVIAGGAGAAAALTFDGSVNLTAKTKVTVDAGVPGASTGGELFIGAASGLGVGGFLIASGKGAKTTVSQTASVNITGSAASFNGHDGLVVQGAASEGAHTLVGGTHSGSISVKETGTVNLKATVGALTLDASNGSLDVRGGHGDFSSGTTKVSASHHGVAALTALAGVSLQAGGALTMSAGNSLSLSAGFGYFSNVNAQEGGAATLSRNSGLSVKAGTTLSVTAGSSMFILGGQADRIMTDTFASSGGTNFRAGGKATANLTAGVTMTAGGDVSIGAGSGLVVEAGAGNQLFVGTARIHGGFVGQNWTGGTATLSANTSVTVTAGRDLHLTAGGAGTGSLQVLGMASGGGSFNDQANVAGGSSNAVAKLSLVGNATLTAVRDITITTARSGSLGGDASIIGGSLGNLRADHALGHVTILGSADATLKAGRDVLLSGVQGSLTVAGVNVNGSHAGTILADAHADQGFASVTGHGDANIIAGRNITTGSDSLIGLNVVAGQRVDAAALGLASNEHTLATANAGLTAGGVITIKGGGDLNVLGGLNDSAAITNTFSNGLSASGQRAVAVQARATITAGGAVTLNLAGDGVIAGGDGLAAKASMSDDLFETGVATADAGVLIKGASVSLTVGGNLLMRGGSSVNARAEGIGSNIKATATASADAAITATGNVTIDVGTSSTGIASFIGGSAGKGSALTLFSNNAATATVHSDLNVTAGKAISVTAAGDIKVAGGPGAENSGLVIAGVPSSIFGPSSIGANSATAIATVTTKVSFTAGTTLNVAATHGNVDILGGSRGADNAVISAIGGPSNGHKDHATLTVDQSVNMKAAAITLTADGGLGSVNVTTFVPSSSAVAPALVSSSGAGNTAKASVNDSVTIIAKTPVTINATHYNPSISNGSGASTTSSVYTNGNLTITGSIKVTGQTTLGIHPAGVRPGMVRLGSESLRLTPDMGTTSFGRIQSLGGVSVSPAAVQPSVILGKGIELAAPAFTSLDTVQAQGLVVNLVTVAGTTSQSKPEQGAVFTPSLTPDYVGSFPSSCATLVVSQAEHRCPAGSK